MSRPVTIYGLTSSSDGKVRYIGQTVLSMGARMRGHRAEAKKHPSRRLSRWMASVIASGATVIPVILTEEAIWSETEKEFIAAYKAAGADLVNGTEGGDGGLGRVFAHTEASKAKISAANLGRKLSEEECKRRSQKLRGKHQPWLYASDVIEKRSIVRRGIIPSNLADLHQARKGSVISDEMKQRISSTLTGRKQSKETVAKRVASFKAFWAANPEAVERRRAQLAAFRKAKEEVRYGLET